MNIQPVPEITRLSLLGGLGALPDEDWLLLCSHPDQEQHWRQTKAFFKKLETMLRAYFEGSGGFPYPEATETERNLLTRQRDRWLLLSLILHDGWDEIVKKAEEAKIADVLLFPSTPREMLLEILTGRAIGMFWECLEIATPSQSHFSPSSLHKRFRECQKLNRCAATGKGFTQKQQSDITRLRKDLPPWQFRAHENFCIAVCEKASKRNRPLGEKMKLWKLNEGKLETEMLKVTHPQKGTEGHQWVNGQRVSTKRTQKDTNG